MTTKIYGASDDLVEIEGDVEDEICCYGTDDEGAVPVLLVCSDGTILNVKYGKGGMGIWGITLLAKGGMYGGIDQCIDEDADPYSDVATFHDGLSWIIWSRDWKRIKAG